MINSKKGFTPVISLLLALIVIVGGLIGYNYYSAQNNTDNAQPTTPPDTSQSVKLSPTQCPEGQLADNSGKCIIPPCPAGTLRNNVGECVASTSGTSGGNTQNPGYQPTPQAKCEPKGYLKNAYTLSKDNVGWSSDTRKPAVLSYTFVVTNDCDANFYVEGGLVKTSSLTFMVTQPSACDGNPHFAGKFIAGNKNTKFSPSRPAGEFDVAVYPQDYNKAEKLKIVGGVYTGCLKDNGKTLAEIPPQIVELKNPLSSGLVTGWSDTDVTLSFKKIV